MPRVSMCSRSAQRQRPVGGHLKRVEGGVGSPQIAAIRRRPLHRNLVVTFARQRTPRPLCALRTEAPSVVRVLTQMGEIRYRLHKPSSREERDAKASRRIEDHAMVTVDEFSRLVSAIYGSAIDPDNWMVALAEICRAVDATGGGLLIADGTTRHVMNANVPLEAMEPYSEYYRHID